MPAVIALIVVVTLGSLALTVVGQKIPLVREVL